MLAWIASRKRFLGTTCTIRPCDRVRRVHGPGRLANGRNAVVAISVVGAIVAWLALTVTLAGAAPNGSVTGVVKAAQTITRIESLSRYRQSDWGYSVLDQKTGRVLLAQNQQKMFDPGSTMKTYSVFTGLRMYGPNYRFRTPVYRQGTVAGGTLSGNLVLLASGDLTFGLREQRNGTLYYDNLPRADHSYADQLPGAVEPPGDPFAALSELAAKVRASGITQVNGDVVIDDRLFDPYAGFPDGLISPMWVNENLIDLLVTPTFVGRPATINVRPMTATYTVTNRVITVGTKQATNISCRGADAGEPRPVRSDRRPHFARAASVGGRPSFGVRPHGLHRGTTASRCDGDGTRDRRQPHRAPAAEGKLRAVGSHRRAHLAADGPVREVDLEGELQPRR